MKTPSKAILILLGGAIAGLAVFGLALIAAGYGWTAQMRIDCGDLRYVCLGIPVFVKPMPEPERSSLIALADESLVLNAEWLVCATYPRRGGVESDERCRIACRRIAAWIDADRTIARLALENLAEYIDQTGAREGAPECAAIFGPDLIDATAGDVLPNWRSSPSVREFAEARGYTITTESTTTTQAAPNP